MVVSFVRYRNRVLFILLVFLGVYLTFHWYVIMRTTISDDKLDNMIQNVIQNTPNFKVQLADSLTEGPFNSTSFTKRQSMGIFYFTSTVNIYNNSSFKKSTTTFQTTNTPKNHAFIIDTTGCKIPKLDPWDHSVLEFIEILDPLICSDRPLFMTPEPNGIVHLNETVLIKYYNSTTQDLKCLYRGVRRLVNPDMVRENDFYFVSEKQLVFNAPIDEDHIAVTCVFSNNYTHEQYMPLTSLKDNAKEKSSELKPSSQLNVVLLGIDSVSKLNFFRHFRRTKAFLNDKMNIFDMKGYTKIADNTFPNLMAMLTGHFAEYYWNESMTDTFYFDNISLIWKDYSRQGYRTFFAEDAPIHGTFNYFKRGFLDQPTDYYYRPLALALESSKIRMEARRYNSTCLNSELEMDLMNNYLKNFIKTMGHTPYFAFSMVSTLTHDVLNYASYSDLPTLKLIEALDEEGALNNTLLVMFSDHGIRYSDIRFTYIGKFEERMPFMYIHVPKWFLQQHPIVERNLITNQERLITLFDIHATLKHLLHLNKEIFLENTDELGSSIFKEIPESRTCDGANIQPHWCPCTQFTPVLVSDGAVTNAASALVRHINELLVSHGDVCRIIELAEITDALRGVPNFGSFINSTMMVFGFEPPTLGDYLITFRTKPGDAMFEGTVRYDAKNNGSKVMDISRINMYRTQSWCIDSPKLKLFCYCNTQIE